MEKKFFTLDNAKNILYIIGCIAAFILFIVGPQYENQQQIALIHQSVNTIKTNDLEHLGQNDREILAILKEMQTNQESDSRIIAVLQEKIIKLELELNK